MATCTRPFRRPRTRRGCPPRQLFCYLQCIWKHVLQMNNRRNMPYAAAALLFVSVFVFGVCRKALTTEPGLLSHYRQKHKSLPEPAAQVEPPAAAAAAGAAAAPLPGSDSARVPLNDTSHGNDRPEGAGKLLYPVSSSTSTVKGWFVCVCQHAVRTGIPCC